MCARARASALATNTASAQPEQNMPCARLLLLLSSLSQPGCNSRRWAAAGATAAAVAAVAAAGAAVLSVVVA